MINFKHSGDLGDIVASLPTVKAICEKQNDTARFILDTTGGIDDPWVQRQCKNGTKLSVKGAEFLKPLLEIQPYISEVKICSVRDVLHDVNLNVFRGAFVDFEAIKATNQNLMFLHQYAMDLPMEYEPWLTVPGAEPPVDEEAAKRDTDAKVFLFARSTRYQSAHVPMQVILEKTKGFPRGFMGLQLEYDCFVDCFNAPMDFLKPKDALDAARKIKKSANFVVNGTLFYWLAVGMGHPSIVHELGVGIPTTYFPVEKNHPNVQYMMGTKVAKSFDLCFNGEKAQKTEDSH